MGANDNSTGISIIGLLLLVALIYLLIKHIWTFAIIIGVVFLLIIIAVIALIYTSKKTKTVNTVSEQIRNLRSKIRQEKFKAENNIKRLQEWAADAIYTTYSDLFGNKYTKNELLENYEKIRIDYATEIEQVKADKCDEIVNSYKTIIETEKQKIKSLNQLQEKYDKLYQQLQQARKEQKQIKQLDKHYKKIEQYDKDIQAEKTIVQSQLNLADIQKEIEHKQEYFKQLEELNYLYNNKLSGEALPEYKQKLEQILKQLK